MCTDHPRSRGVYAAPCGGRSAVRGSSPLARGLPVDYSQDHDDAGIIPARAGFTSPAAAPASCPTDHPRSRGVYLPWNGRVGETWGSSPLARGLPLICCLAHTRCGIIPARAGFTEGEGPAGPGRRDHPRSRGVYPGCRPQPAVSAGSSPLARGLRAIWGTTCAPGRIIPARAGFTCVAPRPTAGPMDHPRSRGVYATGPCAGMRASGSSPLARGLLDLVLRIRWARRIIPARAGFTAMGNETKVIGEDHPRSRGVYSAGSEALPSSPGSSPLARGLQVVGQLGHGLHRIIPARAGFTAVRIVSGFISVDHPRSRGVY